MAKPRYGERPPVDAAVVIKAPVLGCKHGAGEGRGDVGKPDPVQAPPCRVYAHLMDHVAVPVQEHGVGEPVRGPHFFKRWELRPREIKPGDERAQEGQAADEDGSEHYPPTFY